MEVYILTFTDLKNITSITAVSKTLEGAQSKAINENEYPWHEDPDGRGWELAFNDGTYVIVKWEVE